jgi:hypothetical protein
VWLGTTPGIVLSWSNTQITATVTPNAQSGTVQVLQGGVCSGSQSFSVSTATISNVVPTTGLPGTQVTISGTGFGSTQGSGQVWLGTANAVVQSWSDTQVVALVGPGATSGNAQVLQSGVISNAVSFNVNLPHTTSVSPTSGGAGTSVTIAGSGFGSVQGSGTVWLGSQSATATSWSDTEVVAVVASGALTGIARVQQNGMWSNALAFTVPGGSNLTLGPNLMNLVIGDTQPIQALNSSGQSVTGLTWASSDPTVVSLSTDDPPILTALAAGHVTITADTGSADVTVSATDLPMGTVLWSTSPYPSGGGGGEFRPRTLGGGGGGSGPGPQVIAIVPAVPSTSGVDVFALQDDATVHAITTDGLTAWTLTVPSAASIIGNPVWTYARVMPDFQGGLVVSDFLANGGNGSITKVDGITGQAYPAYNLSAPPLTSDVTSPFGAAAVHTDGTIFAFQGYSVIGIDPTTGTQKFSVPLPIPQPALDLANCPSSGGTAYGEVGLGMSFSLIVAGDGNAYAAYAYNEFGTNCSLKASHLRLLQVSTAGAYNLLPILDAQAPGDTYENTSFQVNMITNADTGVLVTWSLFFGGDSAIGPTQYGMAITVGTSVSIVNPPTIPGQLSGLTLATPVIPVLQAQDGSFLGTVTGLYGGFQTNMVSFDQAGNVRWMVPNEQPLIATAEGGVIGHSGTKYDENGSPTAQVVLSSQSWIGYLYEGNPLTRVFGAPISLATSFWAFQGANNSKNLAAALELPDRVNARSDVLTTAGSALREIVYETYQGTHEYFGNHDVVISEKHVYVSGAQPSPSQANPGDMFDDLVGTLGRGPFVLKQTIWLSIKGKGEWKVSIGPCTAGIGPHNGFGALVPENTIMATKQTVLINNDAGSTAIRSCGY